MLKRFPLQQFRSGLFCLLTITVAVVLPIAAPARAFARNKVGPVAFDGQVVISQIYAGGGQFGATYNYGYVELFNRGTTTADLSSASFMVGPGTGNFTGAIAIINPSAILIQPGQHKLIQFQATGNFGASLPNPDFVGGFPIDNFSGKFALVAPGTFTIGPCQLPDSTFLDFVGFGTTNCFEGSGPAPQLSVSTALIRRNNGCTDTNDASNDFVVAAPNPHNGSSPFNPCSPLPPAVTVSGRVVLPNGRGVSGSTVTITDSRGVGRIARTSSFGYFSFDSVATSDTYTIKIESRLYRFAPQTIQVTGNLTLPDFVGLE